MDELERLTRRLLVVHGAEVSLKHSFLPSECIRPAKSGLELRRQNCPALRQKRIDLVSGRRIEARQDVS
jgi:hypothetical protein